MDRNQPQPVLGTRVITPMSDGQTLCTACHQQMLQAGTGPVSTVPVLKLLLMDAKHDMC